MRWLFPGRQVVLETRCLDCGETIRVTTRDETVVAVEPESAVGFMPAPFARSRTGSGAFN